MSTLKKQYLAMNDANRFLLEHCEKTLAEIRKAYEGVSHSANRCNAEYAACKAEYAACWEAVKELKDEMSEANAAIGKLQGDMVALEALLAKAREAYSKLKNTINSERG